MFPLKDKIQLPGNVYVTFLLVVVNAAVFYLELTSVNITALIHRYALIPAELSLNNPPSLMTLVTSQFLHGGWFHFLANMWFLLVFGPNVERAWGWAKFLVYYLICGMAAIVLQLIFTTNPAIPMLGASGAIAGILGAYFVYFPHHRINTLVPLGFIPLIIGIPAGIILLYWFALQVIGGLVPDQVAAGGIAFFAHIGGFIMGVLLAVGTKPTKLAEKNSPFF